MNVRFWKRGHLLPVSPDPAQIATATAATRRLTHRGFLRLIATGGGVLLGTAVMPAKRAMAAYTPGSPSDIVDTNLTVQGNLVVNQKMGIGTSSPQGQLEVAESIYVNGQEAVGTDGVAKASYYAQ